MPEGDIPSLLRLEKIAPDKYTVFQPAESAEGRDVVFSGQLLAQMIMAADDRTVGAKDIKSVQTIFCRAGSYSSPIELVVDPMQAGRTWASDTISAMQNGKLLSRALVLSSIDDPDLIRHGPPMPHAGGPDDAKPDNAIVFPGAEARSVAARSVAASGREPTTANDSAPVSMFWHRYESKVGSPAANAAVLSWATAGQLIGLAFQAHVGEVDISQAHRTLSTGVIGHAVNFHERFDVSQWLLVCNEATYAGRGRVHGRGTVYTQDGLLVATFSQDSMARKVETDLDPGRSL